MRLCYGGTSLTRREKCALPCWPGMPSLCSACPGCGGNRAWCCCAENDERLAGPPPAFRLMVEMSGDDVNVSLAHLIGAGFSLLAALQSDRRNKDAGIISNGQTGARRERTAGVHAES